MGWGGSKNKKNKGNNPYQKGRNRQNVYRQRSGFTVTKSLIQQLSENEKDEYALFVDIDEFFERDELPTEMYINLLKAIKNNKSKEYTNILQKYKISTMDVVVGLNETVEFGNK